jgi:enediyne biosynthesis protein E4
MRWSFTGGLGVALLACGTIAAGACNAAKAVPFVCVPGRTIGCECPGGEQGLKDCLEDGSGFGVCTGCVARGPCDHGADGAFTDVTAALGLPESSSPCVGFDDFDGDGLIDVIFGASNSGAKMGPSPAQIEVHKNLGGGKFAKEPSAVLANGLALICQVGDLDNDGKLDVIVGTGVTMTGSGSVSVYHNDGNMKFHLEPTAIDQPLLDDHLLLAMGLTDYDADGWLDLVVGRSHGGGPTDAGTCGMEQCDFACKVNPDPKNPPPFVYRNDHGTLRRQPTKLLGPYPGTSNAVAFADFDRNGLVDVFMSNDWYANHIHLQKSPGVFEHGEGPLGATDYNHGMGVAIADYDLDGNLDVYSADLGPNNFWFGKSDHTLENLGCKLKPILNTTRYHSNWAPLGEDFNNDGLADVFVASSGLTTNDEDMVRMGLAQTVVDMVLQQDILFWNHCHREFNPAAVMHRNPQPAAVILGASASGDYDGDGDLDVLVTSGGNLQLRLLRNDSKKANSLEIQLVGTKSSRDGAGAEVYLLKGGAVTQRRVYRAGGSIASSWHRVHFGLGSLAVVEQVQVRWPSGKVQTVGPVEANKPLTITEN